MTDQRTPRQDNDGPIGPDRTRTVVVLAEIFFASRVRGAAQASGVQVITAARTDRFLEQARDRHPNLLIVDLELRGQDVPAVIRSARADAALRDVPILAFSSHMNVDAIQKGRAAGADRVLARSAFVQNLADILAAV